MAGSLSIRLHGLCQEVLHFALTSLHDMIRCCPQAHDFAARACLSKCTSAAHFDGEQH